MQLNKFRFSIFILLILLILLFFTGRKSVQQEILIDATQQEVWNVISATTQYSIWNPVFLVKKGHFVQGQQVLYQFTESSDNQYDLKARIKKIEHDELLNQCGGIAGIFTFDHYYLLESVDSLTKLTIKESYRGIGVNFWSPASVEQAYIRLAKAIKERAESLR